MTSTPKIRGAKCDKRVDWIYMSQDNYSDVVVIKVKCHGETDEMSIDLRKLSFNDIKQIDRQEGLAFTKDLLESRK